MTRNHYEFVRFNVFSFAFAYTLNRHKLTHTGIKPYECKFCDRAFSQNNDLVKHLRSHVGVNTYQCHECPSAFRFKNELEKHSNEHYLEQKKAQSSLANMRK